MSVAFNNLIACDMLKEGYECSLGYNKLNDICMDILLKPKDRVFDENAEIVSAIDINFDNEIIL